jgi:hypothetical protein
METPTAPIEAPVSAPPSDKLRLKLQLLREKLGQAYDRGEAETADPIEFIANRRLVDETRPAPMPFYKIAQELSTVASSDVTHETVRRWHRDYTQSQQPAA